MGCREKNYIKLYLTECDGNEGLEIKIYCDSNMKAELLHNNIEKLQDKVQALNFFENECVKVVLHPIIMNESQFKKALMKRCEESYRWNEKDSIEKTKTKEEIESKMIASKFDNIIIVEIPSSECTDIVKSYCDKINSLYSFIQEIIDDKRIESKINMWNATNYLGMREERD